MVTSQNGRAIEREPQAKPSRRIASLVLSTLLLGTLSSCTVPAPTVQQGLDYGFNTPVQAIESFRTAVQGNMLDHELRCFSQHWKDRTDLGNPSYYSLARDKFMSEIPQLRWALYRADDPELVVLWAQDALLQCRIPGPLWTKDRWLIFHMHREGYWEARTEQTPEKATEGNTVPDPVRAGVLQYVDRYDVFRLNIDRFSEETDDTAPEAIINIGGGWHWKIKDFTIQDEPETKEKYLPPTRASVPVAPAGRQ